MEPRFLHPFEPYVVCQQRADARCRRIRCTIDFSVPLSLVCPTTYYYYVLFLICTLCVLML